jgi:hypothetical protein
VFSDTSTVLVSGAVIEKIDKSGLFAYFMQVKYVVEYFFPSSFFEGKEYSPILTHIAATVGPKGEEVGAAVLGVVEYYHTAGNFGVIVIGGALGYILGCLNNNRRKVQSLYSIVVYFVLIGWLFNSFTRGYLPQNIQDLISLLLGLWALKRVVDPSRRSGQSVADLGKSMTAQGVV